MRAVLREFDELHLGIEAFINELDSSIGEDLAGDDEAVNSDATSMVAHAGIEELERRAWEVCGQLSELFPTVRMLVVPIPGGDLFGTFVSALGIAASRASELDVLVQQAPRQMLGGPVLKLLQEAVGAGSSIRFVVCPSGPNVPLSQETLEVLNSLKALVQDGRGIAIQRAKKPLPSSVVLDGRMVGLGWGSWFRSSDQVRSQFGFLVESSELGSQLRLQAICEE